MLGFFGYLIFIIFYKWGSDYTSDSNKAPSLIGVLMSIPLKFGDSGNNIVFGDGTL